MTGKVYKVLYTHQKTKKSKVWQVTYGFDFEDLNVKSDFNFVRLKLQWNNTRPIAEVLGTVNPHNINYAQNTDLYCLKLSMISLFQ